MKRPSEVCDKPNTAQLLAGYKSNVGESPSFRTMVEIYEPFDKISPELRAKWIFILEVAYNEPQRHYHTLSHIRSMFERLNEIRRSTPFSAQELQILQLSIWFHDVVYETTSEAGSNEYLSALKFGDYARDIGLVTILGTDIDNFRKTTLFVRFNI